jgi:hypothetical protein
MTDSIQNLNPKLGAPFTAKSGQANPDDVLREIMEANPSANEAKTWPDFRAAVLGDEELTEACVRWYHVNARRRIEGLIPAPKQSKKTAPAAEIASRAALIKTAVRTVAHTAFLDITMPNNKLLRACTFKEVGRFGEKFKKLAAMGKPGQIVGRVLSEKQACAVLK